MQDVGVFIEIFAYHITFGMLGVGADGEMNIRDSASQRVLLFSHGQERRAHSIHLH